MTQGSGDGNPSEQSQRFEAESLRFVATHLSDYPSAPKWLIEHEIFRKCKPKKILDVGCGPGYFLDSLVSTFDADIGVGIEPSDEAVKQLSDFWQNPRIRFVQGFAHGLPFESDAFDLVVCWSVLHWVGRNEYLQALGELLRVTRSHLVIMDFVAAEPYRVSYRHDSRLFTYKVDFSEVILGSGIAKLEDSARWWDGNNPGSVQQLDETDLRPFLGNQLNYHARRACIFRKDFNLLPLLSEHDFT